jgi:putative FmdB family regulatory protein
VSHQENVNHMPTYNYRCTKGHVFELFHSMSDERAKRCPRCGARARRVPAGGAGLLFKGTGFYITDYRSKSYRDRARADKPAGEGGGAKPSTGEGGSAKTPSSSGDAPNRKPSGEKKKSSGKPGAGAAS